MGHIAQYTKYIHAVRLASNRMNSTQKATPAALIRTGQARGKLRVGRGLLNDNQPKRPQPPREPLLQRNPRNPFQQRDMISLYCIILKDSSSSGF